MIILKCLFQQMPKLSTATGRTRKAHNKLSLREKTLVILDLSFKWDSNLFTPAEVTSQQLASKVAQ